MHALHRMILSGVAFILMFPAISFAGQYKCTRIIDGDTIIVADNRNLFTVRLVGIDAPELPRKKHRLGQPFCLKAKDYLSNLVLNKVVNIKFYGTDPHGQLLAEVFVDGVNINLEMIWAGLAEVYRGAPAANLEITTYRDAEMKAKESVRGIWVLRDQYFSPWDWREIYQ